METLVSRELWPRRQAYPSSPATSNDLTIPPSVSHLLARFPPVTHISAKLFSAFCTILSAPLRSFPHQRSTTQALVSHTRSSLWEYHPSWIFLINIGCGTQWLVCQENGVASPTPPASGQLGQQLRWEERRLNHPPATPPASIDATQVHLIHHQLEHCRVKL